MLKPDTNKDAKITKHRIEKALTKRKYGRAPGEGRITNETIAMGEMITSQA